MTEVTEKLAVPIFTKTLRKKRGWTQADLAHEARVSVTTIHNLEAGKNGFTDKTLKALSAALGCKPWELLVAPDDSDRISGEESVKKLLSKIDGLPKEAINPLWHLISGYIEDAA